MNDASFIESIERRYGVGVYDPKKTPTPIPFPQARPFYTPFSNEDFVAEHGEWCRSKCVYDENEAAIDAILREHANEKAQGN